LLPPGQGPARPSLVEKKNVDGRPWDKGMNKIFGSSAFVHPP